jgi:hypothetical protein
MQRSSVVRRFGKTPCTRPRPFMGHHAYSRPESKRAAFGRAVSCAEVTIGTKPQLSPIPFYQQSVPLIIVETICAT